MNNINQIKKTLELEKLLKKIKTIQQKINTWNSYYDGTGPKPKGQDLHETKEYMRCSKKIKKHNLNFLGHGVARAGYSYKNLVIKISKGACGINCNREEFLIYKNAPKKIKPYLAKCYHLSKCGNVLIMEKLKDRSGTQSLIHSANKKLEQILPAKLQWDYWHNYGFRKSIPVLFDYATEETTWSHHKYKVSMIKKRVSSLFRKRRKKRKK